MPRYDSATALVIVDVQNDFCDPAGGLSVRGGDAVVPALDGSPAGHWPAPGPWLMLDSYWKPFAAVRHVHYGAQAALRARVLGADPAALDAIDL